MKLYSVDTFWRVGAITEYDVVKETEKTYVIREVGRPDFCRDTLRKSVMRTKYERYCLSLDEVKEVKKKLFEEIIESNKRRIASTEKENAEMAERLEALVAGDINA